MNPPRKRVSSALHISLVATCPRAPHVRASWLPGPLGSGIGMDTEHAAHTPAQRKMSARLSPLGGPDTAPSSLPERIGAREG